MSGRPRKRKPSASSSYSEELSDSQSEQQERRRPEPRFYKHSLDRLDMERIVINVSRCHYPLVQQVARKLGWKVEQSSTDQNWDICWMDGAVQPEQLFRMHLHQKINHFPGMYVLARKDCLGRALMRMRKHSPGEYDFFPTTWHLPSELGDFTIQFEQQREVDRLTTYIVKPEASCQGKGIFLSRKLEEIVKLDEPCVVQRYLSKPYLIGGLKFDFRLYVLLAGCDPLRIYLYNDGLVRFATKPYIEPNKQNIKEAYIHLTNYAINKDNPAFVFNTSSNDMNVGHKRSLQSVLKLLEKQGCDTQQLLASIHQLIVKTIITGQPLLSHLYNLSQPENYGNDMCFQILGFDVLMQSDGSPMLLEVNHTPSFVADTPLDESIKGSLIRDTLHLMNVTTELKQLKVDIGKERQYQRSMRKKVKLTVKEKHDLKQAEQRTRDQYEDQHLGQFQRIYPVSDSTLMDKYANLLGLARSVFNKSNINNKKIATEIRSEASSPSPLRSRIKTLAPREAPTKELLLREVEQEAALLTSLPTIVPRQIKDERAIKSTVFEVNDLFDPGKKTKLDRLDQKKPSVRYSKQLDNDFKIESRINQKIREIENGGIEKALRLTRSKLERLKKLSLYTSGSSSPVKTKKQNKPPQDAHPKDNSQSVSSTRKGNFLAPKLIRMAEVHEQSTDRPSNLRKNISNYEKFMVEHDLRIAKRLAQ